MGLYYSLIKVKNGERYNLWGRNGDKYTDGLVCHGLGPGDPEPEPFKFLDIFTREELIERVWNEIHSHAIDGTREGTVALVDDILNWCGDDEVIHVSDHYYEYLDYNSDGHYHTDQHGRAIVLTGSGYTNEKEDIRDALDTLALNALAQNSEELE